MKKVLQEFKEFAFSGNLIEIAVAFILALKFKDVVDSFVDGVIMPIIAAIGGKQNFDEVSFKIGDGRILIGTFINTIIAFVIIAAVLFLIVKAYEQYQERRGIKKPDGGVSEEIQLLREIRDSLRTPRV